MPAIPLFGKGDQITIDSAYHAAARSLRMSTERRKDGRVVKTEDHNFLLGVNVNARNGLLYSKGMHDEGTLKTREYPQ